MAAEPDRVAGTLANGLANFILFELIFKPLGLENSWKSLSSLTTWFKEDGAAFALWQNHLERVPPEVGCTLRICIRVFASRDYTRLFLSLLYVNFSQSDARLYFVGFLSHYQDLCLVDMEVVERKSAWPCRQVTFYYTVSRRVWGACRAWICWAASFQTREENTAILWLFSLDVALHAKKLFCGYFILIKEGKQLSYKQELNYHP